MKKIELTLFFIAVIFLVMKILAIPWSGVLLAITLLIISCFYYFLAFALLNKINFKKVFDKSSYKNLSAFQILFTIAIGWTYSTILIGLLFELEFLPYASFILLFGIITIGITTIISLFLKFQTKSNYYNQILLRNLILGGIGLYLFCTS